jgi:hypothetical protein
VGVDAIDGASLMLQQVDYASEARVVSAAAAANERWMGDEGLPRHFVL